MYIHVLIPAVCVNDFRYNSTYLTGAYIKDTYYTFEFVVTAVDVHERTKMYTYEQYVYMYGHTYSKNIDQPDKVANPARGQLNREHS